MKRSLCLLLIFIFLINAVGCAAADAPSAGIHGDGHFGEAPEASLYMPLDFVWNEEDNGYYVYEKDDNPYTDIVIPETYNEKPVVGIGKHAFGAYSNVRSIIIPDSVTVIESKAFNYCDYLESVVLSSSSSGLTHIEEYAFYNCKSIKSISLPASVQSIGYRAFSTCPSLINIYVDENNDKYCSQGGAVYSKDMNSLVSVAPAACGIYTSEPGTSDGIIPNGQQIIPEGVQVICAGAFADCDQLISIRIPDSVTVIEKAAFIDCDSLIEISFGENSSLVEIGEGAFRECASLKSISIPQGVQSIGRYAFYCDNSLIEINYLGSVAEWNEMPKGEKWDMNTGDYTVSCADGVIEKAQ